MFARWMRKFPISVVLLVLIIGLAFGCSTPESDPFDQSFGESYRHTMLEMLLHPEPPAARAPTLEGLDPLSAEMVLENYKKGLERSSGGGTPSFLLAPVAD